ncbi:MAG: hypothetical protein COA90_11320 [Gammaproteobacteria bacterium]|nr:MAG: hypothetical protein COA90_11320 [Gammaproteobacteria bacterium]
MSYTFKLDSGDGIIEVVYSDIVTYEQRMQAIKEGLVLLQNKPSPKILINLVAAKIHIFPLEKVTLAQYISEQHALIKAKTAFLIRCEQTEREEIDSAVLRSDEFISQVFYSRSKAIQWLNET